MIFYFVIVADSLSFLDPAGNTLLKMSKIKSKFQSISGIWTSLTALNVQVYTNLYVNGTQLFLCDGKAKINYQFLNGSNNRISFQINSATGCSQNEVLTSLYKSYYYRWEGQVIHLYDQNSV